MGTVTLAVPSLHSEFGEAACALLHFTRRLAMELSLLALLFASLVSSVMAVRYYNHAGFVGGMPVESDARKQWTRAGTAYVGKAGVLYSWGLRQLLLLVRPWSPSFFSRWRAPLLPCSSQRSYSASTGFSLGPLCRKRAEASCLATCSLANGRTQTLESPGTLTTRSSSSTNLSGGMPARHCSTLFDSSSALSLRSLTCRPGSPRCHTSIA